MSFFYYRVCGLFKGRCLQAEIQRCSTIALIILIGAGADLSRAQDEQFRLKTEKAEYVQLTSAKYNHDPSWSPDGRKIAYVSFEGESSSVYVQTLRTGVRDKVSARLGVNGAPVFSPDGRKLLLTLTMESGNLDIYSLDLAGQVLTRMTRHPSIDTEAVFSPDGETIYFTSDRSGGPQIYKVANRPGARAERVTFEGNYNARPRISPSGEELAVVHQVQGNFRIAVVDPNTGLTQVLTNGMLDESPSFAPNGAQIIYATRQRGRGVLASVSVDGRIHRQIVSVEGEVREPVWSPFPRICAERSMKLTMGRKTRRSAPCVSLCTSRQERCTANVALVRTGNSPWVRR